MHQVRTYMRWKIIQQMLLQVALNLVLEPAHDFANFGSRFIVLHFKCHFDAA